LWEAAVELKIDRAESVTRVNQGIRASIACISNMYLSQSQTSHIIALYGTANVAFSILSTNDLNGWLDRRKRDDVRDICCRYIQFEDMVDAPR
jgi:predicted thioredoxin/glutaredoxin